MSRFFFAGIDVVPEFSLVLIEFATDSHELFLAACVSKCNPPTSPQRVSSFFFEEKHPSDFLFEGLAPPWFYVDHTEKIEKVKNSSFRWHRI